MQAVLITFARELASQDRDYSKILLTQSDKKELANEFVLCSVTTLGAEEAIEAVAAILLAENEGNELNIQPLEDTGAPTKCACSCRWLTSSRLEILVFLPCWL